jgi:hypothetical protein
MLIIFFIFPDKLFGPFWLVSSILILGSIMLFINNNLYYWTGLSEKGYKDRLMWGSLLIRILVMIILLVISYLSWDTIYYVGAKDEMKYFRIATESARLFDEHGLFKAYDHLLYNYRGEISDVGFPFFQTLLIILFGPNPIIIKILLCVIGTITVIRGYHLACLLFEPRVARLSGILLMLYPISWFYSAVMMKEIIMVFLITESLIQIIKLKHRFTIWNFSILVLLIAILFFFRTALSFLLLITALLSLVMIAKIKRILLNLIAGIALVGLLVYFLESTDTAEDYYEQYIEGEAFEDNRVSFMAETNSFAAIAGSPAFFLLALVGPFPSIVKVPLSQGLPHNEYYYHIAGNFFWVFLAFFSLVGLYYAIRYERSKLAPLWLFAVGYQFVLIKALMYTSVRFTFSVKPFLLIIAAYGFYKLNNRKWYSYYLIAGVVMIVAWNYVRLTGRGE